MAESFEPAKNLFLEGIQCFEAGRLTEAQALFQASLALLPDRASTLTNLGATQIQLGKPEAALNNLDRAVALEPGDVDAWCHRGVALGHLARHDEALTCFDKALASDAGHTVACYHRAITLNLLHRHAQALHGFDTLVRLQPDRAEAWFRHGQTLQALDRHGEALPSYDQALALEPTLAQAWSNRGGILKDLKRVDEAALSFEKAIAHGADPEVNGYFLASLRGGAAADNTPTSAPKPYVEFLFDEYANTFDQHLVGVLHYRAHNVLVQTLQALTQRTFSAALDLGCGTGLCAPLLQPLVDSIDGVDLSRNMLAKARARGSYRYLAHGDVAQHLQETLQRYDLVVSGDVVPYIGDLDAVFGGARRVLNAGGVLCFSAEAADDSKTFVLLASLRYAHSQRYLRELATVHSFEVLQIVQQTLREDQRQPIAGLFVYLRAG